MDKPSVKHGVYLGIGVIILTLLFYFISARFMLSWGNWVGYILTIALMVMAVKEQREIDEGFISLGTAFKTSWITYVIGTAIAGVFSYILIKFIDTSLLDVMKEIQMEALEKMSGFLGEDGLEKAQEAIEEQDPFGPVSYGFGMLFTFIFPGALFAIIIAAIMKNNRPDADFS
jgi:uncharacterized integral membrane protein